MEEGQGPPALALAVGRHYCGLFPEIRGTVTLMPEVFELLFGLSEY